MVVANHRCHASNCTVHCTLRDGGLLVVCRVVLLVWCCRLTLGAVQVSWPYSAGALLSFIGNVAVLFVLSILLATANSKTQASDTVRQAFGSVSDARWCTSCVTPPQIGTWIAGIIALIVGIVTSFVLPR